jgi:hypothetical protein
MKIEYDWGYVHVRNPDRLFTIRLRITHQEFKSINRRKYSFGQYLMDKWELLHKENEKELSGLGILGIINHGQSESIFYDEERFYTDPENTYFTNKKDLDEI